VTGYELQEVKKKQKWEGNNQSTSNIKRKGNKKKKIKKNKRKGNKKTSEKRIIHFLHMCTMNLKI